LHCILRHTSAPQVYDVIRDANEHGAAVLGVPMKATVKESEDGQFVLRTVDRSRLWEIQTPQVGQTVRCVCDVWTLCSENVHTTRDVASPDARPAQAITRVRHRENDDDDDDDNEEEEEDDDHDDDDDDADAADVKMTSSHR
jgi:hypothetical protein